MADENIRKYHDALRKQIAAAKAAHETITPTRDAADLLKDWWKATVGDDRLDNKPSSHLKTSTLNSQRWPTFDQMTKAIKDFQKATADAAKAWEQLDSNDKEFEARPTNEPPEMYR